MLERSDKALALVIVPDSSDEMLRLSMPTGRLVSPRADRVNGAALRLDGGRSSAIR